MRSVIPDVIHNSHHLIWLFFIFFMSLKHDGGGEGDLSLNQQYHNFHLVAKSGNGEGLRIS